MSVTVVLLVQSKGEDNTQENHGETQQKKWTPKKTVQRQLGLIYILVSTASLSHFAPSSGLASCLTPAPVSIQ